MRGKPSVGMMGGTNTAGDVFTGYAHGMASSPRCVGFGLGKWWVGCVSGQLYSSPNGRSGTWTLVTTFSSFVPAKIEFVSSRLIIIATNQVKWSTDGSSFSSFTFTAIGTAQQVATCFGGGYYIVSFGGSSAGKYLWTADFSTWTVTTNSNTADIYGFVWDGSKFLATRNSNQALQYFSDPAPTTAWSTQGTTSGANYNSVGFYAIGSRLIRYGSQAGTNEAKRTWTDDGGTNWSSQNTAGPSGTDTWVDGIIGNGAAYLIMNPGGTDASLYRSVGGGSSLTLLFSATGETLRDVSYGDGRFTAVSTSKIYIDR